MEQEKKLHNCGCGWKEEDCAALRMELESAQKNAADNLNLAKYQKAEFENFKKRNAESVSNAFNDGKTYVIMNVLPVLDNFVEAVKAIGNPNDREGIEILYRKLESILTSTGLEEIPAKKGDFFDPRIHNAIMREKCEGAECNTITKIWQSGYRFAGRIIRPTTVTVAE